MNPNSSKKTLEIRLPPGATFEIMDVQFIDGDISFNFSEMRNLLFYSNLNPVLLRNKKMMHGLVKQYYYMHRNNGGEIYDFLENDYQLWKLSNMEMSWGTYKC